MSETEHEHEPVNPETVVDDGDDQDGDEDEATGEREGEDEAPDDERGADGDGDEAERQQAQRSEREQQKAVEKMFKAFEGEASRHTKRIAEIAGDSAPDLILCPMCLPDEGQPPMPGWLLPVEPSPEKIASIRAAIGLAPAIEYVQDRHSRACESCNGLAYVLSGSKVTGQDTLPCVECGAKGWVATDELRGGDKATPTNGQGMTGPLAPSVKLEPEPPEVQVLRSQHYTVIPPYNPAG